MLDPETLQGQLLTEWQISVRRADVTFLLDTTGSMAELLRSTAQEFAAIAVELDESLPFTTYGLATFADYPTDPFGSPGDLPFVMRVQQTTDLEQLQRGLSALEAYGGGDGPESALEAIYQALTGRGYDLDCDGGFSSLRDVPAFIPNPEDPFGGLGAGADQGLSGSGKSGGMGYRMGALPVIIYGTDAPFRDPDSGDAGPGGCFQDAGTTLVNAAAQLLGARFIGVMVEPFLGFGQAEELARASGSLNEAEIPLVLRWRNNPETFRPLVVGAVQELVGGLSFETVRVNPLPDSDTYELFQGTVPEAHGPVSAEEFGHPLEYVVSLEGGSHQGSSDLIVELPLALWGDDAVELGQQQWIIVIPGRGEP